MKLVAGLALVATMVSATAHADNHTRVEIIATDAASDAMITPRIGYDARGEGVEELMLAGLLVHTLGAPTIHALHGEWRDAGIDLGIRAVAPVIGFVAGDHACERWNLDDPYHDYNHCVWFATVTGAAGVLGAQVLDWLVLTRSDPHVVTLSFGGHF